MPTRKHTPTRKASGSYVHETQRHTTAVKLRLPHEVAETLRARAADEEMTLAGYLVRLATQEAMIV